MIITEMQARKLLADGCVEYSVTIVDRSKEEKISPTQILIVREIVEVFPEDLSGLPPEREISFENEFLPETRPISKAPYRMALGKLKRTSNAAARTVGQGSYAP